jgi:thiol-disulfide isomerase/thioredoxin
MRFTPLIAVLVIGLSVVACQKPSAPSPGANEAASVSPSQPVKGVDLSHKGKPASSALFDDPDGKPTRLANFTGKPLLVNLWATWCAPCVKELPTLDRLALSHEKDGTLRVLAVSQDFGPHASVEAFLKKNRIEKLAAYQDAKSNLSAGLGAEVLPTSILFDARGREVWRYVGDLDWTGPEAAKLLSQGVETQKR